MKKMMTQRVEEAEKGDRTFRPTHVRQKSGEEGDAENGLNIPINSGVPQSTCIVSLGLYFLAKPKSISFTWLLFELTSMIFSGC